MTFPRMVLAGRLLLGLFYLISGLNWFFGYMPILPSMHSPPDLDIKHQVMAEMIKTGWMFQFAKVSEVIVGLALLANRAVPFTLAFTVPVAFIIFMLDAMILGDFWGWITGSVSTQNLLASIFDMVIGGLCVLLLHVWLMLCHFDSYKPMFVWKADPSIDLAQNSPESRDVARKLLLGIGAVALALQAWNFYLFVGLIQW
jgi:hypothetical protein